MPKVVDLGSERSYNTIFELQKQLLALRQQDKIEDTLLLLEHKKVITVGNSGNQENILFPKVFLEKQGFDVVHINRGGDVTYHGPGQLVGYFIFNIHNYGSGVREFFEKLEEIFIQFLGDYYNIEAHREKEYPGVWVGQRKIIALGCAIKRGVSMHGFGFNVNTNLNDFQMITPCGIPDREVTSLERAIGHIEDMNQIKEKMIQTINKVFNINLEKEKEESLMNEVEKWNKENQIG